MQQLLNSRNAHRPFRIYVALVGAFVALIWLVSAAVAGTYFALDGGHGGKPAVIAVAVAVTLVLIAADLWLIRGMWRRGGRAGHDDRDLM